MRWAGLSRMRATFLHAKCDAILVVRGENKCQRKSNEDGEALCFAVPEDLENDASAQLNLPHGES